MLVIGLTGGIGCGKSAVSGLFQKLGAPVIDADLASREVVRPGQPALQEIVAEFGPLCLNPDGTLNRNYLREKVFRDSEARQKLEGILHPRIRSLMDRQLAGLQTPYALLSIPLLLETGQQARVDRILVVDCPVTEQIERICQRDGISPEQAAAIIDVQSSREARLAAADDIIDNSGPIQQLEPMVRQLHGEYLQRAEEG